MAALVVPRWWWLQTVVVLSLLSRCECAAARLYTEQDPLVILTGDTLRSTVTGSSSAWLVQFYSSWCGHCIQYSATWKALARDVRGTGPEPASVISWTKTRLNQGI